MFVTANDRHICVLAEECGTAKLGESYDSEEREFFPILAEFALDMLRPHLQYYDGSYTPQAAFALSYLIKTNQLKGKLIAENGEQIRPTRLLPILLSSWQAVAITIICFAMMTASMMLLDYRML